MRIRVCNKRAINKTYSKGSITVVGGFWYNNEYYTHEAACDFLFSSLASKPLVMEVVKELIVSCNGSFMFCLETSSFILVAVDKTRSIPLYYSNEEITDRIRSGGSLDQLGCIELLSSGYTIGSRTVFSSWCALEPGEFLIVIPNSTKQLQVFRYFDHRHHIINQLNENDIEEQFISVSRQVIETSLLY